MLTLYHFNDATCGTKVRLVLAEKQIDVEEVIVTREQMAGPEYRKLNPDGVVPTLVVQSDGRKTVLRESSVIMAFLDELKSTPSLMPELPIDRARVRWWMKRADDVYLPALGAATYATIIRQQYLPINADKIDASLQSIEDPGKRAPRRYILMNGLESPIVRQGVKTLGHMLLDINAEVRESEFLCGDAYTLGDAAVTPFFVRCDILGIVDLMAEKIPDGIAYWSRLKARPSFETVVTSRVVKPADEGMRSIAASHRETFAELLAQL